MKGKMKSFIVSVAKTGKAVGKWLKDHAMCIALTIFGIVSTMFAFVVGFMYAIAGSLASGYMATDEEGNFIKVRQDATDETEGPDE